MKHYIVYNTCSTYYRADTNKSYIHTYIHTYCTYIHLYPDTERMIKPLWVLSRLSWNHPSAAFELFVVVVFVVVEFTAVYVVGFLVAMVGKMVGMAVGGNRARTLMRLYPSLRQGITAGKAGSTWANGYLFAFFISTVCMVCMYVCGGVLPVRSQLLTMHRLASNTTYPYSKLPTYRK